jgi:SAM-dependent methyltransferase
MSERVWLIAQLDAMHQSRGGDWYYRTFTPGQAMAAVDGVHVVNFDQAHRRFEQIVEQADVLVVNMVCSADLLPIMQRRKQNGSVTVFEINGDVAEIQPSNPLSGFFSQPENIRLFRRLALSADALQYSVAELQRLYGSLNPRGRVFANQLAEIPAPRAADDDRKLSIGWGGSSGHLEDIAEMAPTLIDFVRRHPNVTLALMCSDRIWQLFDALPSDRKRRTPIGSIQQFYAFVGSLDIGLAPNRDKGFNRARSDVKYLEYAAYGAVPVLQRLTPYLDSVKHGQNGFLFDTPAELAAVLERLVAQPDERSRVRQAAYVYVSEQRRQALHAAERLAFYAELLPQSPPGSNPKTLFSELAALARAEVSGRHVMLAHTRYESLLHDGLVLLQSGKDRDRGAAQLREAAQLEPTQSAPHLFLGAQLQDQAELLAAVTKNPRSVQAVLALGAQQLEQGQFRPALERFMAAAELAPGYEMPFLQAALALERLGARKEASEFARMAEGMAAQVAPATPPVAASARPAIATRPATPAASASAARPAWHLLDEGVHLQTLNPNYAPTGLLELIEKAPRRVLDLGCFCGGSGRYLKRKFPGCEVIGIEMLPEAAKLAAEAYDRVHVGTLEQLDFAQAGILPQSFDAIIAADVLEHLFHPWQALLRLRPLLAPGGSLYVSLPNARNLKLLSELGRGRFDYAGAGILDVTHVRFFTRKTAVEMLEQTGFAVDDVRINPDNRLASVFEGKRLDQTTSIELDGLTLNDLTAEDLLELAALQLYLRAHPA